MCPLCIATGTFVLASAGSAGGLGALAAKVFHASRKRTTRDGDPRAAVPSDDFQATPKASAGPVARSGTGPAKAA
jgi:hypothetical protein